MSGEKLKEVLEKGVKIRLYSERKCPKLTQTVPKSTQKVSKEGNKMLNQNRIKDHYYAFVNKGMVYSPGAVKQFEGS